MSKELDEIFKEGLKDRKVSFNPDAWNKAEAMLNNEQGKSRRGFVWWKAAAAALVLVSFSVGGYFVLDSDTSDQVAEKQKTEQKETKSNESSDKLSDDESFNDDNDTPRINQNPEDQLAEKNSKAKFSATSKRNQKRADQMRFAKTSEPNRAAVGQTYSQEQSSLSDVKSSSSTGLKQENRTFSLSEIPLLEKLLSNSVEENSLDHTIYTDKIPDFTPVVKHRFFLIGGGMASNAYKTGDYSKNYAIDPFGGFGYEYLINPNFSLEADVLYLHRSGVNTTKTIESGEYSFGRVTDIYNINHEVLHYLELPVFANYRIGNNMIKAGVGVSYLINSKSTVEHIHNTPFEQQVSTSTEYGHNDGFNKLDYSVQFGYERLVLNRLNIGARGSYGFADVVKDDYYNHSAVDNNLNIRIYAKYNLANL